MQIFAFSLCLISYIGGVAPQGHTTFTETRWIGGPTDIQSIWQYLVRQFSSANRNPFLSVIGNDGPSPTAPMPTEPDIPPRPPVDTKPKPPTDSFPKGQPTVTMPTVPPTVTATMSVEKRPSQRYCTSEYRGIPGHTLCMRDKPNVRKSGMSRAEQIAVLKHHNDLRASVQPPASDLVKLKWDDRLAAVAQKWANQCAAGHDKVRDIPSIGMPIGQNVAGGYRSWHKAVQMWYDEIKMWRYGIEPDSYLGAGGWRKIGHFTQMVQNGTYLVGCGYAECSGSMYTRYYVCDYAAGQSNLATPYTAGRRCGACPNSCRNGQCDCRGKVCMNGGELDPNNCKCRCTKTYKGPTCEEKNCPAEDAWVCERDWTKSYCDRFVNVPEECPYMCGVCKRSGGESSSGSTPNRAFVSSFGCSYRGKRSSLQECRRYGNNGQDIRQCSSMGGNIGCDACERYYNVKKEMCPVMCGLCDPPCNGKMCLNGGSLDVNTCQCTCVKPYIGPTCKTADCSRPEGRSCPQWPRHFCDKYVNVPQECPRKCGIC